MLAQQLDSGMACQAIIGRPGHMPALSTRASLPVTDRYLYCSDYQSRPLCTFFYGGQEAFALNVGYINDCHLCLERMQDTSPERGAELLGRR
jgi:hypothetical protein